ncbi:hypothetical protein SUGI_0856430 [Cryptomeria japonica]|uniref:uncharacterized protein LOC131027668 isoform X7 n=1 Tax=Cryptomeria japonica TaxID=3369 RepID=UPI00241480FB|nr:uncharacterized protein LOC131027668 isoform X7 [Cryptomeria japonica]GLJ41374.1 hypothetical protein SUGI_0856430 [Cryptomeria japonica]
MAILSSLRHARRSQYRFFQRFDRNLHNKVKKGAHEVETSSKNVEMSTLDRALAKRCKNVLAASWQGILTTVKSDSAGSKEELHSSPINYILRNEKPMMWVDEDDLHTVNTILDERGSLCIDQANPPSLTKFLKTIGKFPPRVVLVGDVIRLDDDKVDLARKELSDMIYSEKDTVKRASHPVTNILSSSGGILNARVDDLQLLSKKHDTSAIFEFNIRSVSYLDIMGNENEINVKLIDITPMDPLSPFFEPLLEGINRSEARRRGLMLFCSVYLNVNARDALMLSVDRMGFDLLAKVSSALMNDASSSQYQWKDYNFSFGREVEDIETFCRLLAKMEEEALKKVSGIII